MFKVPSSDIMSPEDSKLSGNLDMPSILRYIIFQMTVAKATLNFDAYNELGEWLEMLLSPYEDSEYKEDLKKIEEDEKNNVKKTHPNDRDKVADYLVHDYSEKKIMALIKLMARKHLLLQTEITEEI